MVIDSSALVAIVLNEPSAPDLLAAIERAGVAEISAITLLESGIVLRARKGAQSLPYLYGLIEELGCRIVAFGEAEARAAVAAFGRFGKGMGHRAQLNLGDCAVYGLAALRGEPVLATGRDFTATDIAVVRV
jgi:ribonuclease VapC